jgi:hypothetical protein
MKTFYNLLLWLVLLVPSIVVASDAQKGKRPPANLAAEIINSTTVKLTWMGTLKDEAYRIRIRPVGVLTWTEYFVVAPSNARRIHELTPGTSYQWQVQTVFGKSPRDTSAYTYGPTFKPWEPCETPQGLITMLDGNDRAALIWFSVGDDVQYNVKLRAEGTDEWMTYATDKNVLVVNGLEPNKGYEWSVSAACKNSGLESERSDKTYFATSPNVLDASPVGNYAGIDADRVLTFDVYGDAVNEAVLQDGMGRYVGTLPVYYTASNGTVAFRVNQDLAPGIYNVSYRSADAVQSQTLSIAGDN